MWRTKTSIHKVARHVYTHFTPTSVSAAKYQTQKRRYNIIPNRVWPRLQLFWLRNTRMEALPNAWTGSHSAPASMHLYQHINTEWRSIIQEIQNWRRNLSISGNKSRISRPNWPLWFFAYEFHVCYWLLDCKSSMINPDSKVHGANMGPIWVRKDLGGPHVGPMNVAMLLFI